MFRDRKAQLIVAAEASSLYVLGGAHVIGENYPCRSSRLIVEEMGLYVSYIQYGGSRRVKSIGSSADRARKPKPAKQCRALSRTYLSETHEAEQTCLRSCYQRTKISNLVQNALTSTREKWQTFDEGGRDERGVSKSSRVSANDPMT